MKKKNSTKELIGVKQFTQNGILTEKGNIAFFTVKPTNISVLSEESIALKIRRLTELLSAYPDIEIICMDARENFSENKRFLDERLKTEENKKVRKLLKSDRTFLDNIHLGMSTSREFMFACRPGNESEEQVYSDLNRKEKLINEQGFECRRAGKEDIKRMLSRYFNANISDTQIDDIDGETGMHGWMIEG